MRVFLDTNIWISLFIGSGTCIDLVEHCRFHHTILSSEIVLEEVDSVLRKKFHYSASEIEIAMDFIRRHSELVKEKPASIKIQCRDKSDELILRSALTAGADVVITGDQDLLVLSHLKGIRILTPSQFWHFEKE